MAPARTPQTAGELAAKAEAIADHSPPILPGWRSLVEAALDSRYSDEFVGRAFRNRLNRAMRGDL